MNDAREKNNGQLTGKVYFIALALLIILAGVERIYGIDRQSLWGDELYAVMASYLPSFHDIWPLLINDSHPPGYVALMYWITPRLGYSDFAIRLHALVYGILWVPLVYWIGKRWFSYEVGLLAAAIIANSYSAIYFSQEARAYSMLVTFCLGNLICFLEILFSKNCHRSYIPGFIISAVLILYLHYTCFVFFAAEALLYMLFWASRYHKGSLSELAKLFGIPLLLYSPWLGLMVNHLTDTSRNWAVSEKPSSQDVYYAFQYLWGPNNSLYLFYLYSLTATLLWAVYQHIKFGFTRVTGITYTLFFLLIIPVLAFYIESIVWTPIFEKRYFLVTLPLLALIIAFAINQVLRFLISSPWQTASTLFLVVIVSTWMIQANIDKNLYTSLNKDPVREAVHIIKNDITANALTTDYTVLMTHDWFEHYLRQENVAYDPSWDFRRYYVPQHIGKITEYFHQRPKLNIFYYLAVNTPTADAAIFALKQNYKLVSATELKITTGGIKVFKFSTQGTPVDYQPIGATTNPTNEAAKTIAREVAHKNPASYTTLITHDWMQPYLSLNNIQIDKNWAGNLFQNDIQFADIAYYLRMHPAIDTLYFFALREPASLNSAAILELQYRLASQQTFDITAGKLDVYRFNVKTKPVISPELTQQVQNNSLNKPAALIAKYINHAPDDSYAVTLNHNSFEPYLHLNNIAVDEDWEGRNLTTEFQVNRVLIYVKKHPAIKVLYYLALRSHDSDLASALLQSQYPLLAQTEMDTVYGKINVSQFDTKTKPSNIDAAKTRLAGSPLYASTHWIKTDANKTPAQKYTVLLTHDFFSPYLQLNDVAVDQLWRDRFFSLPVQADGVFSYLKMHPDITTIYYLALLEPNTQPAIDALKKHATLLCQKWVDAPPQGRIGVMKFNLTATPANSQAVTPTCPE